MPRDVEDPDRLFELATRYYSRGLEDPDMPDGYANLVIASSYLLPFILQHDNDPRVGEALYMMGNIRSYSFVDPDYWSENHYLKQGIHRFPHTELAERAFKRRRDSAYSLYSRAGVSAPPDSILEMLENYRKLRAAR